MDNLAYRNNLTIIIKKIIFALVVLNILLFFLSPLLWLISTSFKNFVDAFALPPKLIFTPTLENYQKVLGNGDFFQALKNTLTISSTTTLISIIVGVPAAYAIDAFTFKRKKNVIFFVLSTRIAPPIMSLLPMYIVYRNIGLLGTKTGLIIMYLLICLPLTIWLMPAYFKEIPGELREAAIIDGCNEFQVFRLVILPLVKSSVAAVAILCVVFTWNEFLIALVMSNKDSQTLSVLVTSFMTFQGTEWGPLAAAGTLIMLPMIIFGFFVQKYFAKGMVSGAVKG